LSGTCILATAIEARPSLTAALYCANVK